MTRANEGGALAVYAANVEEVRVLVGKAKPAVEKFVGKEIAERFMRAAVSHYIHAEKPQAMHAVNPKFYIAAVLDAAMDGLTPDGRDGWIIPYGETCHWHPSWRGLLKLARRATTLRDVSAEVVYEGDQFHLRLGSDRAIEHVPYYAIGLSERDRGPIIGAYAGCRVAPSWTYEFRFVDRARLDVVASMSGNPSNDTPSPVWNKHFAQQAMKHCFRKLCDWIEMPDKVLDVLAREDERHRARVAQVEPDAPRPKNGTSLADDIRGAAAITDGGT